MKPTIRPKLRNDLAAEILIDVRFSETDLMGVVHHSHYFDWFDIARLAVLRNMGIELDRRLDFQMPVASVNCDYIQPARFGDRLSVTAALEETTVAKYIFHFTVRNDKTRRLVAKATTVSVLNKNQGGLMIRLPEKVEYEQ
ncbi:MAG: acyl-CoA thioesterase [Pseudomonadota bacterium]